MTHLLWLGLTLAHAIQYPTDFVPAHFRFERRVAANCARKLDRRHHLGWFGQLDRWYPNAAPGFRRAFVWKKIRDSNPRVLLGRPRRMPNDPLLNVIVPMDAPRGWPVFIATFDLRRAWSIKRELRHLPGLTYTHERFLPEVENGIRFHAPSMDLMIYDRPGTHAARVEDAMKVITTIANKLGDRVPRLGVVKSE